jgi:hypothetical protein
MRKLVALAALGGIVWALNGTFVERFGSNGAIAASAAVGAVSFPILQKLIELVIGARPDSRG